MKCFYIRCLGMTAAAGCIFSAMQASALTETFTVSIEFNDPFTITQVVAPDFGQLIAGIDTHYSLDAGGQLDSGPGGSPAGGNARPGEYLITDTSNTGSIDIFVGNPVPDGGVSITSFICDYQGGVYIDTGASCELAVLENPGIAGETLLVGFDIAVSGTQEILDTASPGFDITVAYQ